MSWSLLLFLLLLMLLFCTWFRSASVTVRQPVPVRALLSRKTNNWKIYKMYELKFHKVMNDIIVEITIPVERLTIRHITRLSTFSKHRHNEHVNGFAHYLTVSLSHFLSFRCFFRSCHLKQKHPSFSFCVFLTLSSSSFVPVNPYALHWKYVLTFRHKHTHTLDERKRGTDTDIEF